MKYNVEAIFSLTDHVTGPVRQMAAGLKNLDTGMGHVTSTMGALKAAAGATFAGFGVASIVRSTEQWYEQVEKLNRELGMSAREASGIMGAFSLTESGVEALTSHTRMWAMNMKGLTEMGEDMAMAMGKTAKSNPWKDLKDRTAVGSLLEIADKVKKSTDPLLVAATYYRRGIAQQMLPALKLGRQGLIELMAEAKKSGVEITEAGLASFARFKDARRELELTWKGLSLQIGTELMPVLKSLVGAMRDKLLAGMIAIKSPLKYFAENMDSVLKTVKAITYYMMINKGLMMTTGAGVFGNIGRGALAVGAPIGKAASAVRMGFGLDAAMAGVNVAGGRTIATMLAGVGGSLQVILAGAAKLSLIGTLIYSIGAGALAVYRNTSGIRDFLVETWGNLRNVWIQFVGTLGSAGPVAEKVGGYFSMLINLGIPLAIAEIMAGFTKLGEWFKTFSIFVQGLTEYIRAFVSTGSAAYAGDRAGVIMQQAEGRASDAMAEYYRKQYDAAKKIGDKMEADRLAEDRAKKAMRGKDVNLNFPGAVFNIKQDFRDQDPDRVAVVFQEDLQALALNRVTSNVTDLAFAAQTGF